MGGGDEVIRTARVGASRDAAPAPVEGAPAPIAAPPTTAETFDAVSDALDAAAAAWTSGQVDAIMATYVHDEPLLPVDVVSYHGQPVEWVVADSDAEAEALMLPQARMMARLRGGRPLVALETVEEAARAFRALLSYGRAWAGYAPITRAPWLTALAHRSPFAEAFRPVRRSSPDAQRFLAELKELPRDEWLGSILRLVSDQISLLLRRTVDPDRPLPEYGLDSLASLEFRTRIETETGVRVGPAQLTTVRGLSQHVCDQLAARVENADSPGGR